MEETERKARMDEFSAYYSKGGRRKEKSPNPMRSTSTPLPDANRFGKRLWPARHPPPTIVM
jgi:hypothetical protein